MDPGETAELQALRIVSERGMDPGETGEMAELQALSCMQVLNKITLLIILLFYTLFVS